VTKIIDQGTWAEIGSIDQEAQGRSLSVTEPWWVRTLCSAVRSDGNQYGAPKRRLAGCIAQ